jgi:hypothetical protein
MSRHFGSGTEQCVANVSKISGYEKEVMLKSEE